MFCDFILISDSTYRCSKCETLISTNDGQVPIFPCKVTNLRSDLPNLADKIKNFLSSLFDHTNNSFKLAKDGEIERRFKICETCDSFKNGSCLECGCPIIRNRAYISKLSWDSEKCPKDKW